MKIIITPKQFNKVLSENTPVSGEPMKTDKEKLDIITKACKENPQTCADTVKRISVVSGSTQ